VYLKSIQMIGFKSFADRTDFSFEPGMTAIVGPNGCGKSNVADAVRWVLGEQSAKALRGSKMEDCIFSGTDNRKPLAMAEVSILFADCETVLGTEFNEVTVTRRVFRSGEGQYFLNRTPCRLKDIQRLFMNTGIGTASYSVMEQGRIDQVLSSRPEDRREIFEEASGITKFKADKAEALRKLEHTEANLLRLDDVIREVKRQIGSLQRQAGKARRYKELKARLSELDVYRTAQRLRAMDGGLAAQAAAIAALQERAEAMQAGLREAEAADGRLRTAVLEVEHAIAEATEARATAQTRLDRNTDRVRVNGERIRELQTLAERDGRDAREAEEHGRRLREALEASETELAQAGGDRDRLEAEWKSRNNGLVACERALEALRQEIETLRAEGMNLEGSVARIQNDLAQMDAEDRTAMVQRDRLSAERAHWALLVEQQGRQQADLEEALRRLQAEAEARGGAHADLRRRLEAAGAEQQAAGQRLAELRARLAGCRAQVELLGAADSRAQDFPPGARLVLDPANPLGLGPRDVLGSLAGHLRARPGFETALEAVLRAWHDAVVVADRGVALSVLSELQKRRAGSARLLVGRDGQASASAPAGHGVRLSEHVECAPPLRALATRLLGHVVVLETLAAVPATPDEATVYVTREGAVVRDGHAFEHWVADLREPTPLGREHALARLQADTGSLEREVAQAEARQRERDGERDRLAESLEQAARSQAEGLHAVAVKEGEILVVSQATQRARERLETVSWELDALAPPGDRTRRRQELARQIDAGRERQAAVRAAIESRSAELQARDRERSALYADVTEARVRFSEARQRADHLASQREPQVARLGELERLAHDRAAALTTYAETVRQLTESTAALEAETAALKGTVEQAGATLGDLRRRREASASALASAAEELRQKRDALDRVRAEKNGLDVRYAEERLRRQHLVDHVREEYGVALDREAEIPEPAWDGERPGGEAVDAMIAELRGRIEAMGPVNLVAIEEHQELEERHAFLTRQQADLINSRQMLLEMIRSINVTTAEMFRSTFERINENFQAMFQRLFGGGTARLVLSAGEDVLEAGIEIVARPPGKRLQSVSLLSGGERTLTAVALLFAIYAIRPSPFCILDELDASLDEANIGRFIRVLQDFLAQSQFVVITHNRQTIAAASVIYGVTMAETGVSRVISMKFSEYEQNREFQQAAERARGGVRAAPAAP
jgi:chromosome segregation protein